MQRLVIASNNPGKLREFDALLAPLGWAIVSQRDLGIGEAEEPYLTFLENALAKARFASAASGLPALADDSGLCVHALGGAPGVQSARYAVEAGDEHLPREEKDRRNNAKLVAALAGVEDRSARYVCVLAMVRSPDDPEPLVTFGHLAGCIVDAPRGAHGFGYDAHFFLPAHDATAAELDPETKNRVSHRGMALRALVDALAAR